MSSAASRARQRQRRRARERLWEAQKKLAERQVDLVSYIRVIADIDRRYENGQLPPFSGTQAASLVKVLREMTQHECDALAADVSTLEVACAKLEPQEVSP